MTRHWRLEEFLREIFIAQDKLRESPEAAVRLPSSQGSFDSADRFTSESACSAQDDNLREGTVKLTAKGHEPKS